MSYKRSGLTMAETTGEACLVIDDGQTADNIRKLLDLRTDPPCLQERADEAAAKLEAAMLEIPNFYAPVKGRILEQAKGPNRAADRARGIYKRRKQ